MLLKTEITTNQQGEFYMNTVEYHHENHNNNNLKTRVFHKTPVQAYCDFFFVSMIINDKETAHIGDQSKMHTYLIQ